MISIIDKSRQTELYIMDKIKENDVRARVLVDELHGGDI